LGLRIVLGPRIPLGLRIILEDRILEEFRIILGHWEFPDVFPRISKMTHFPVIDNYSCCRWNNRMHPVTALMSGLISHRYCRSPYFNVLSELLKPFLTSFQEYSSWFLRIFSYVSKNFKEWRVIRYCMLIHIFSETTQYILWQPLHLVLWNNNWDFHLLYSFLLIL